MLRKLFTNLPTFKPVFLLLIIFNFILFNYLIYDLFFIHDMSKDQRNSFSSLTEASLDQLYSPLKMELYISTNLPAHMTPKKNHVINMLKSLQSYSKEKVSLDILYKDTSVDVFKELKQLGIPKINMNVINKDKVSYVECFAGLVIYYQDQVATIPIILDSDTLDYDLALIFYKFVEPYVKSIAFVHDNIEELQFRYSIFLEQLADKYNVDFISYEDIGNVDYDSLIFVRPQDISEDRLKLIDNYMVNGGNSIFFVDNYVVDGLTISNLQFGLTDYFKFLGLSYNEHLILDTYSQNVLFNVDAMHSNLDNAYLIQYPYYPLMTQKFYDDSNPVYSTFQTVVFPWTFSFDYNNYMNPNITITPLMHTNLTSWKVYPPYKVDPKAKFLPFNQNSYPLILYLEGQFNSYFSDQYYAGTNRMLVIPSSHVIRNMILKRYDFNTDFFINLLDWFMFNDSELGVPQRFSSNAPLKRLTPSEFILIKWVSMLFVPFIMSLCALLYFLLGKK